MKAIRRIWRKIRSNLSFVYWTAPLWIGCVARFLRRRRIAEPVAPSELERLDQDVASGQLRRSVAAIPSRIRLVSWNICYGFKLERVLRAMREDLQADIYLLQEVDRNCDRSGRRHVAAELARELCLHYVYAIEFQELAQQEGDRPAFHGQAVLSRFPIRGARILRFPMQPADWTRDAIQPRFGGRMALVAEVLIGDLSLIVYDLHLENRCSEEERLAQFGTVLGDADSLPTDVPVVIAGDLNTVEHTRKRASRLVEGARQAGFANTFCRWKGDRKTGRQVALDWILARGLEGVSELSLPGRHASDHKPVCMEFTLGRTRCGPM